jgi:glutaredoxin
MAKLDWVPVVDRMLDVADRALDRVRKTPRRRLDAVPPSKVNPDPFAPAPVAAPVAAKAVAPVETPLGEVAIAAQIYGRRTCMWSGRSQRLLIDLGTEPSFYDLDDPEHRHLESRLVRETKQPELPWIYVRGEFIGATARSTSSHASASSSSCCCPRSSEPQRRSAACASRHRRSLARSTEAEATEPSAATED